MFVHEIRVRYVECDMQGHVFNAHYLTWADMAQTAFWAATVGPYGDFVAGGFDFVVAEANVRYRAPCRFEDLVSIAVAVEALGSTSMTSKHVMRRAGTVVAEVRTRHVCVDAATHEKAPWPDAVRAAIAPHVVAPT
ncbi:acyl-CoA thioesterase [Patulibacter sp. S7RM1-6]